ncbi:MAG: relaxase/mobilization nuclease domain-containing protein [Azonexus sp.]
MIIKGRAGTGGPALARYLEQGKNDHAELLELRNMAAPSLKAAIFQMDALARASECEKHALHVQMRAAPGERLSADHWREAVDRYAAEFKMEDHQAAIVLHHQPDGCTHCHVVFSRVHPETLKAADVWQNYPKHKQLSRQMEQDWGLQQVSSQKRDQPRDYSNAGRPETEQARRAGNDVHAIRARIRVAWDEAQTGQDFPHTLARAGFTLAQGERRDFVAVDDHGHAYSIGQRTTGASAAKVRAKLADLDPAIIPTLAEVREAQQEAQNAPKPALAPDFTTSAEAPHKRPSPYQKPLPGHGLPARPQPRAEPRPPSPRYYIDENRRLAVWEAAAEARLERMKQRHSRAYDRQQRGFDEAAKHERGAAVKSFNDQQREDLTRALKETQAGEVAAELERQQQRREKRDQWAAKQLWAEYRGDLQAALDDQHKERQRRAGGFKTHLREEWTRQRQQPAHVGATNDNRERPAPELQHGEASYAFNPVAKPGNDNRPPDAVRLPDSPAQVKREAEILKAEKIRRAKEIYRQWTDDGHTPDTGRGRELKP